MIYDSRDWRMIFGRKRVKATREILDSYLLDINGGSSTGWGITFIGGTCAILILTVLRIGLIGLEIDYNFIVIALISLLLSYLLLWPITIKMLEKDVFDNFKKWSRQEQIWNTTFFLLISLFIALFFVLSLFYI